MDEIENFQDNINIKAEVKAAASKAMEKLKKYYQDTDALPYTITTSILLFYLLIIIYILFIFIYILLIFF
jgi:hypothetical protein